MLSIKRLITALDLTRLSILLKHQKMAIAKDVSASVAPHQESNKIAFSFHVDSNKFSVIKIPIDLNRSLTLNNHKSSIITPDAGLIIVPLDIGVYKMIVSGPITVAASNLLAIMYLFSITILILLLIQSQQAKPFKQYTTV